MALLGVGEPDDTYVDYTAFLRGHVTADPMRMGMVTVAIVAATAEERVRQSHAAPTVTRYLDAIERLGYQPTDWEHAQRLTTT